MTRKWTKHDLFLFRTQKLRAKTIPDLKKELNKKTCRGPITND
jgi:hypothetical protein